MDNRIFDLSNFDTEDDDIHESCGVLGISNYQDDDLAHIMYFGLYALQHRGQESCGIAINNNGEIIGQKGIGLVPEVFTEKILDRLDGTSAIGHTRYSTTGGSSIENSQPLIFNYKGGRLHWLITETLLMQQKSGMS